MMALVIDIDLISGRYDAASYVDRNVEEWPPHPARIFCALVASARSESYADLKALLWLEQQPAPIVQASPRTIPSARRQSYVVTNSVESHNKGGSQFYPARTSVLKDRRSAVPENPHVRIVWPSAEPDAQTVEILDALARRVPYIGRSTGVATMSVTARSKSEVESLPIGLEQFYPVEDAKCGKPLRVPYQGYLEQLRVQFEGGRPAWEVGKAVHYVWEPTEAEKTASEESQQRYISPYRDFIVLRFQGISPDGRLTARFTKALRAAVMKATDDPLPEALHGHNLKRSPHVAFLALPNVDHGYADGHLLGMAVAIPNLPEEERRRIIRGVLVGMSSPSSQSQPSQRIVNLHVPGIGTVSLVDDFSPIGRLGVKSERWRAASDRWVSVTPVVLDRYPDRGDVESVIKKSCEMTGLPEPLNVVTSTSPLLPGAIKMQSGDLPPKTRGKLFLHVELVFPYEISGPIFLGAGRYLGIGLMVPPSTSLKERVKGQ